MNVRLNQYKKDLKTGGKPSKGTPLPGEVWWVPNLDGIKDRPILVISCSGGTVTFRKCTSQSSAIRQRDLIEDYFEAGLEKVTYVDPEVRTIGRNRLLRKMGSLTDYDRQKFGV